MPVALLHALTKLFDLIPRAKHQANGLFMLGWALRPRDSGKTKNLINLQAKIQIRLLESTTV